MTPAEIYQDALLAASLLAVDPAGLGGISVRAQAGPVRDRFVAALHGRHRRLPASVTDDVLLGGVDLAATLQAGRPLRTRGLFAEARGATLVASMAERMTAGLAARLSAVMDGGDIAEDSGFAVAALDEGVDDERPSPGLLDRLAFHVDLSALSHRDAAGAGPAPVCIAAARDRLAGVGADEGVVEALCGTAMAIGIASPRAPILALRAARAAAALDGRDMATLQDAALAARLVLAPRATIVPETPDPAEAPPADEQPADAPPPDAQPPGTEDTQSEQTEEAGLSDPTDMVLAAARAALPAKLLAGLQALAGRTGPSSQGKAGAVRRGGLAGRPVGVRPGKPGAGLRLNLVETLRAAAPWQRLRARPDGGGPALRREDFRIVRTEARERSTTIFLVDASGSSALNRLAEAKGAVELLLADCYRRRDEVAVLAFRGRGAQLLLPPTRSLVRARRSLAALPGGGGTPLAAGLDAGVALAMLVRRAGVTPTLVVLTDGRANVTRAGTGGRVQAQQDATDAARRARAARLSALVLDTSPRPAQEAASLAAAMGARYVPMPYASAAGLSQAIRDAAA